MKNPPSTYDFIKAINSAATIEINPGHWIVSAEEVCKHLSNIDKDVVWQWMDKHYKKTSIKDDKGVTVHSLIMPMPGGQFAINKAILVDELRKCQDQRRKRIGIIIGVVSAGVGSIWVIIKIISLLMEMKVES